MSIRIENDISIIIYCCTVYIFFAEDYGFIISIMIYYTPSFFAETIHFKMFHLTTN